MIGIDDLAWRRIFFVAWSSVTSNAAARVTLLFDGEPATSQAWLERHQPIPVIARDRGEGYGGADAKALARMPFKSQIAGI